jgi:YihY family inner membrane protein
MDSISRRILGSEYRLRLILKHPLAFLLRVWRGMRSNQVFLMSGAIAYNALLSLVPFVALILLGLSYFADEDQLLRTLRDAIEAMIPGQSDVVILQVRGLLEGREGLGWVAMGLLIIFSASAFLVLERALERIFQHRVQIHRRHILVSVVIPYLYMLVLGLGLIGLTILTGVVTGFEQRLPETVWGLEFRDAFSSGLGFVSVFVFQVALMSSFYLVLPIGRISLPAALAGGLFAATLWEIVRRILSWYLSTVSIVNVVYGSLGAAIVALLLLEVGAVILLAGAQFIAEYERFVHRERFRPKRGADP